MGLAKRMSLLFKTKASKVLDKAEDPRETLDYSYQRQLEMLQQVKRGVADVATSRKRVQLQLQQMASSETKLEAQARQAVSQGREDLAREALTRRAAIETQTADLERQESDLQAQEAKLADAAQRLQAKVETFRTRKETIKATYTAAEAQTKISEAVSGISEEMGDVGLAMQRAQDKTEQMQARAGALDELLSSGALDDATQTSDPIQAQLDALGTGSGVDDELKKLKAELGPGAPAPAALNAAPSTPEGEK
jgi:phage shock protein A